MATFRGEMTVKDENNEDVVLTVELEINEENSQEIKIDYLSVSDGGPLMRPAKPPRG
jgi:hypothetical protein